MHRITLRQVAALAGVHPSSVSLALADSPRLPTATKERILQAVQRLGYVRSPDAVRLAGQRWRGRALQAQPTLAYLANETATPEWSGTDLYLGAVQARAAELGYRIDVLPIRDHTDRRIESILRARGIEGVIIGQRTRNDRRIQLNWARFCVVQCGHNQRTEIIGRVMTDLRETVREAYLRVRDLGYARIAFGLVRDPGADSDDQLESAIGQLRLEFGPGTPEFFQVFDWAEKTADHPRLRRWLRRVRPEVLISTSGVLLDPLRRHGWEIPEQLGFVALIADEESPEVSGMEIQHRAIAAAAVDLLDAKLRRHEHGVPRTRQALLISPVWRPGQTLRARV